LIGSARADAERLGDAQPSSHIGLGGPAGEVREGILAPATRALPAGVLPPDFLPGYRLQREIHRGGQGIVYHAVQLSTNQSVAIKVMRGGPLAGSSDQIRFKREVQILAELSHPQIVAIRDTGQAGSLRYFIMDHVDGFPLDAYVERVRPNIKQTLRLFANVCDAVNAAHLRGVIHRDLKPGNILVDDAGTPRILDFGLAKLVSDDSNLDTITHAGQFVGTPLWASPEQAAGEHVNVDLRTDVYSLGVILHRLLTGRLPYETHGGTQAILDRIQHTEPISPRIVGAVSDRDHTVSDRDRPDGRINDEVETIVLKCLAKERERRYQAAGELGADIRRYLAGEAINAKRDSLPYVTRKLIRRHRVAVGFVLTVLSLVLVGGAVSAGLWQQAAAGWQQAAAERDIADRERERAETNEQAALEAATMVGSLLPRGDTFTTRDQLQHARSLFERQVASIEARSFAHPMVERIVRTAIGNIYAGLGDLESADRHLSLAMQAARRAHSDPNAAVAEALASHSDVRAAMRDTAGAVSLLREAAGIMRLVKGERDPAYISIQMDLIRRQAEIDPIAVRPDFDAALRLAEEVNLPVAGFLKDYADYLYDRGYYEEALPLQRRALALARENETEAQVAHYLNSISCLLTAMARLDEAETFQRECVDIRARVYADESVHAYFRDVSKSLLGHILTQQGKFAEAELLLLDAHAGLEPPAVTGVFTAKDYRSYQDKARERLIALYDAWELAEPDMGYGQEAAHWRAKLETSAEALSSP
jgi:serine/threonine protein kinase